MRGGIGGGWGWGEGGLATEDTEYTELVHVVGRVLVVI